MRVNKRHTKEQYESALKLKQEGMTLNDISKLINVEAYTVSKWVRNIGCKQFVDNPYKDLDESKFKTVEDFLKFFPEDVDKQKIFSIYSYLLGLYFGDGHIKTHARTYTLSYALDLKYPDIITLTHNFMETFFNKSVHIYNKQNYAWKSNSVNIELGWKLIPLFFPHLGVGSKHLRKIELSEWQKKILQPIEFLRGLMYSDGCYTNANGFNSYRYEFSNCSLDIINLFVDTCEMIGIKPTLYMKGRFGEKAKYRNYKVTIAYQDDVRWLLKRIGDKATINMNYLNLDNVNNGYVLRLFNSFSKNVQDTWYCDECGKNTFLNDLDSYVVNDSLWRKINNQMAGILCLDCFEKKLGRSIEMSDLKDDNINKLIKIDKYISSRL